MSRKFDGNIGVSREFMDLLMSECVDMEMVKALLTQHARGKEFSGIAVMSRTPEQGGCYGLFEIKNFSKKPMEIGHQYGVKSEYGMAMGLGLANRKILKVTELTEQILLVTFEGCFHNYHAIAFLNNWEHLRMPTQKPSEITVAFSDRAPEEGMEYVCTVVEKLNSGDTATNRKQFKIVSATYYGNVALCETEGKPLLVTYPVK